MRSSIHFLALLVTAFAVGCTSAQPKPEIKTAPRTDFPVEAVRTQALHDAWAAIASGRFYICETGTIAIYAPGVPERSLDLVRGLPRRTLPSGCTEPRVFRSIAYAEVFNAEMVRYLSEHQR